VRAKPGTDHVRYWLRYRVDRHATIADLYVGGPLEDADAPRELQLVSGVETLVEIGTLSRVASSACRVATSSAAYYVLCARGEGSDDRRNRDGRHHALRSLSEEVRMRKAWLCVGLLAAATGAGCAHQAIKTAATPSSPQRLQYDPQFVPAQAPSSPRWLQYDPQFVPAEAPPSR
jgi:hypothetical protein